MHTILRLFIEFEHIVKNEGILKGYATEIGKQGVLIEDIVAGGECNFYKHEQFRKLEDLAIEISRFRKNIEGIESKYTYTLCACFCNSVVDITDCMLSDQLLFPLLAHLLEETSNKNIIVKKYYIF